MEDKNKLRYCENFGLMVYDYDHSFFNQSKKGNIGDYIQSLAALQFLPKNCYPYLIDREKLKYYNGPKINLIMNGWFYLSKGNQVVSNKISPIYLSYHIFNEIGIDSKMVKFLKKYEPIGARDYSTLQMLEKKKIKAYFSACLTLTLDIDYSVDDSERNDEIIFVDFRFGENKEIDNSILSLKAYNFTNITYFTHMNFRFNVSHLERFKIAKNLLDRYACAKLIITTRLHAAFPSLALRTPVILVKSNKVFDKNRFSGLYEFLNTIGINEKGILETNIKFDKNNLIINPDKYLEYAKKLKNFMKKIQKN